MLHIYIHVSLMRSNLCLFVCVCSLFCLYFFYLFICLFVCFCMPISLPLYFLSLCLSRYSLYLAWLSLLFLSLCTRLFISFSLFSSSRHPKENHGSQRGLITCRSLWMCDFEEAREGNATRPALGWRNAIIVFTEQKECLFSLFFFSFRLRFFDKSITEMNLSS